MSDSEANTLPGELRRLSFLVAEQNPALQRTIVSALRNAGAQKVQEAAQGGEAWQLWQQSKGYDVILCAANLPGMEGKEILSRVRGDREVRHQPAFILLSSEHSASAEQQAAERGADVFLPKPFPADGLIPKVVEAVETRRHAAGRDTFAERSLEEELLQGRLPVTLVFDRYTHDVECEELTQHKCIIRVDSNYGLGTQLNLRFQAPAGAGVAFRPIKGLVVKTERVPREIGVYRLHVEFQQPPRDHQGIPLLLRAAQRRPAPS